MVPRPASSNDRPGDSGYAVFDGARARGVTSMARMVAHRDRRLIRALAVPAVAAVGVALAVVGLASTHASARSQPAAAAATPSVTASAATVVGQLSGQPTAGVNQLNDTGTTASFYGGDLGAMWSDPSGVTRVAYGDSFTGPWTPDPNGGTAGAPGHICNAVFVSNTPVSGLSGGMSLATPTGASHPTQLAPCGTDGLAGSIVPLGGVYVDGADYARMTDISNLEKGLGTKTVVMKSTDGARTWSLVPGLEWSNASGDPESNFQYGSYADHDGYVYLFGTILGRSGSMYVARVPDARFETKADYQYWTGTGWAPDAPGQAVPVITGGIGEFSVQYDPALHLWLATYTDAPRDSIVLRYATSPVGPWSGEQVVFQGTSSPPGTGGIYGGFMHPGADATDLYLNVSEWKPYQVFMLHVSLTAGSGPLNLVSDGDFADPMAGAATTNQGNPTQFGWSVLGYGKVDVGLGNGYQSPNEGYLYSNTNSFTDLYQTVAVVPHHDYTYTAWARTSATASDVYVGVRDLPQQHHWEQGPVGPLNGYTEETVTFNAGANSQVQVYAGMWVAAGVTTWLQLGRAQLVPDATVGDGGFEYQTSDTLAAPWYAEALTGGFTGWVGVDVNQGWAHAGRNNAYLRTNTKDWNAVKQLVPVQPDTTYSLTGWFRTSSTFGTGYFGVRADGSAQPLRETSFGGLGSWTEETVTVNSGANDFLTVYAGYWAPGSDSWLQIDDIALR